MNIKSAIQKKSLRNPKRNYSEIQKKSPCGYHLVHLHVSHHVDHLVHLHDGHLVHLHVVHLVHPYQALTGSRISIPGFFGTGFCQIPGSRDFSGRDFPIFLIPGFRKKFRDFSGFSFLLHLLVKQDNFHQYLSSPTVLLYHHHSLRSLLATLLSHYPQIDVRNIDQLPCQLQF